MDFSKADYNFGTRSDGGAHGVVLTKPHVVDLILDLAGYRNDGDLSARRLLEPSCGHGAFLTQAVGRLLVSAKQRSVPAEHLAEAIAAFDIEMEHVLATRANLNTVLARHGVTAETAVMLTDRWVRQGDFLLADLPSTFDFVVGNPPYVRIEQLPPELQTEYRRRYVTLYDRADLYVAFIERSLRLLGNGGVLSFICADRWTLNKYGSPLRQLIADHFSVRAYIDLHRASPFESEVIAYPSIFVIANEENGRPVQVASLRDATAQECAVVQGRANGRTAADDGVITVEYAKWFSGDDPWVLSSPEQLAALRDLEARFPLIEQTGNTSVRIGIATGCDRVYIVPDDADIEPERLMPLVMRDDITAGKILPGHRCVINTYEKKGTIDLDKFPRLRSYFEAHAAVLKGRHIAKKNQTGWFRTIDRPYPELVTRGKLLIPDISGSNEVIYEAGNYYPHHNLYFVISDDWDLEVLGGLLCSRVALFFVWSYAVKMRGGYLRFQAQYIRRIRVPEPLSLSPALQDSIRTAFRERDFGRLDALACAAYGISELPVFDFVDTRKNAAGSGTPTAPQHVTRSIVSRP